MAPALIEAGLQMSFDLDARFGLPKKQTISQRDVPGMTRSLIPILKGAGVTAISVGANDGSTPPNVPFNMTTGNGSVTSQIDWSHPMPFVWHDAASGNDILGMWNWPGYGSCECHETPRGSCDAVPAGSLGGQLTRRHCCVV
jgi:hypothetical protein